VIAGFGWQTALVALNHLNAGRFERAFAIADRAHLLLHEQRRKTLTTLTALQDGAVVDAPASGRARLTISDAAAVIGVPVSTIRHWEFEGLVRPDRDATNGYRRYTPNHVGLLQVVAMLRDNRYGIDTVRDVVRELAGGDTAAAVAAAQRRLNDIHQASLRCAAATAALWNRYQQIAEP
jgi:DNA-binding transcriptional MerR regulator